MCAAAIVGVGVIVGVAVIVGVRVDVSDGVGVTVDVGVTVNVSVGVRVRRSGRTMVCEPTSGPDGVCTTTITVTVCPWRAMSYLTHDNASPGCATTVDPRVQGAVAPTSPGLVTDTPAGTGSWRLNCTGIPLATAAPVASVTSALITLVSVPSPLGLA